MVTQEMLQYVKHVVEESDPDLFQRQGRIVYKNMYDHCFRTYRWACRLTETEDADADVVKVSAIFHDCARLHYYDNDHGGAGAAICSKYLMDNGYESDFIEKVVFCVANHCKTFYEISQINNNELKVLRDCDSLDEVGAVSVLWDTMDQQNRGMQPYKKTYERLLLHYNEIKENDIYFHTKTGRRIFKERVDFLKCYIDNLEYELGFEDM